MKCIECRKPIGILDEKCPYCGAMQYDDEPAKEPVVIEARKKNKRKELLFSEEEGFLYGIHPDDEMYRKTMELNILSKDYRR